MREPMVTFLGLKNQPSPYGPFLLGHPVEPESKYDYSIIIKCGDKFLFTFACIGH